MKRTMNVLILSAALFGAQVSGASAFPTPSPDELPPLSGISYAEMHAADIAKQPFQGVAGNADLEPLASESTRADRYAASIEREPFLGVAGNADLEPLTQWTHADMLAKQHARGADAVVAVVE